MIDLSSEVDKQVYIEPDFLKAYKKCLKGGFNNRNQGYIQDLLISYSKWPVDFASIQAPVSLWYRMKDGNSLHSPDFGKNLESRIPNAERIVLPDEGGSLLWTQSRKIIEELLCPI